MVLPGVLAKFGTKLKPAGHEKIEHDCVQQVTASFPATPAALFTNAKPMPQVTPLHDGTQQAPMLPAELVDAVAETT